MNHISGRGSISAIDLCDSLKREVCLFFANELSSGAINDDSLKKMDLLSKDEMLLIVKFRTDRLTLERLLDLKDQYCGTTNINGFKQKVLSLIGRERIESIPLNNSMREYILNGRVNIIPADNLVYLLPEDISGFNTTAIE